MTKKLEDLLNMPDSKEIITTGRTNKKKHKPKHEIAHEDSFRDIAEFDKIAGALPAS